WSEDLDLGRRSPRSAWAVCWFMERQQAHHPALVLCLPGLACLAVRGNHGNDRHLSSLARQLWSRRSPLCACERQRHLGRRHLDQGYQADERQPLSPGPRRPETRLGTWHTGLGGRSLVRPVVFEPAGHNGQSSLPTRHIVTSYRTMITLECHVAPRW